MYKNKYLFVISKYRIALSLISISIDTLNKSTFVPSVSNVIIVLRIYSDGVLRSAYTHFPNAFYPSIIESNANLFFYLKCRGKKEWSSGQVLRQFSLVRFAKISSLSTYLILMCVKI